MSIEETIEDLKLDFETLEEWEHRYEYIIDLGKQLPEYPEAWKKEEYEVHGCQSQVWIHPDLKDGRLQFDGTSDALIVKGLVGLILKVYSNRTPENILSHPPEFIKELGLEKHLMSTRVNGLNELLNRIFNYAHSAAEAGNTSTCS